jgi:hypothetical protein
MTGTSAGTGWSEIYLGGDEASEQALLRRTFPLVEAIQKAVAGKQRAAVRRAFHNKGVAVRVEFEVAADLPEPLQVGPLTPGASYTGFGRFSRSQSFRGRDGELDQRGFAFRLETPEGAQDFLFSNTPTSFARDPVMFLRVAMILAETRRLLVPFRVIAALGLREGIRVLLNIVRSPDRALAFTAQRYWSRTAFQFGTTAARLFVRPTSAPRRVTETADADYLSLDLASELRHGARSFDLFAQLFVDEQITPIEDASRAWPEDAAPPIRLGTVTIPRQDLDTGPARELADRVEQAESFSPWNTASLRPLGSMNRARLEAYNRSAGRRGSAARAVDRLEATS